MLRVLSLKVKLIVAAVLVVVIMLAAVFVAVFIVLSGGSAVASTCVPANEIPNAPGAARGDQITNAKTIDATAAKLGLSGQASRVAIIAAMGESSLINIPYGDNATNPDGSIADSAGLFQQQPHTGWGTPAQVMDPEYATTSFLMGKKHDGSGGLVAVAGWESMEPTLAIHKVQINADPNHYAKFYSQADAIISQAGIDVNRPAKAGQPGSAVQAPNPANCQTNPGSNSGAVLPLQQPYNMTDTFGPRTSPTEGASSWHPALDLQNWPGPCGKPVYASLPGTVTLSDRLWLSIQSPDGFTVSYLHMHKNERTVSVGMTVTAGQQIGVVGDESPATGCHLDIRIDVTGNTNPAIQALPRGDAAAGTGNYINPIDFFHLYGLDICPNTWCKQQY